MSELDRLTLTYARRFPEEFALEASSASREDLIALLQTLPPESAVGIIARLSVGAFRAVCAELESLLGSWLNAASFEDSVALLARLPRKEQSTLVNAVADRSRRRRLRQFLNFPSHSVGSLATELPVRVSANTPVTELLQELQELKARRETPVVVTGSQGEYAGVLDIWRLTVRDDDHGRVKEYTRWVNPIVPEMALDSARDLSQWQRHHWLPVVDHEQRILGYVQRQQVMGIRETMTSEAEIVGESILVLGVRYISVLMQLLERVLSAKGSSR